MWNDPVTFRRFNHLAMMSALSYHIARQPIQGDYRLQGLPAQL